MTVKTFTQSNYNTLYNVSRQIMLPLNIEWMIPANEPVRLLEHIIEEMDLTELNASRRTQADRATPAQLFAILVYAAMNRITSSRAIEKACHRDIHFLYLLNGRKAPDHTTIDRFRKKRFAPVSKKLLAQFGQYLEGLDELSRQQLFIDGTKIESVANKYTFVWKKSILKNREKLIAKASELVEEIELTYGIHIRNGKAIKLSLLKRCRRCLKQLQRREGLRFVHGSGRRKNKLQKYLEELNTYISRLKKYTKQLHIMGERNSYAKTDPDATFMRLKEDAMQNGQLKPAYNIQSGSDSGYVVWVTAGPQPSDTTTLIPFLANYSAHNSTPYKAIVADSGYESEENYAYLNAHGQEAYIKTNDWEKRKTRAWKNDIGRAENMTYSEENDTYRCSEGQILRRTGVRHKTNKSGYTSEITIYTCENCRNCPKKETCIKKKEQSKTPFEERTKQLHISRTFQHYRQESLERLTTDKGKELRQNRSIQAEGVFAEIKANMKYRRFQCRGTEMILAEWILLSIAQNVVRLHNRIQQGKCGLHLYPLKEAV